MRLVIRPEFYRRHKERPEGGNDFSGRGIHQKPDACGPLDVELERERDSHRGAGNGGRRDVSPRHGA